MKKVLLIIVASFILMFGTGITTAEAYYAESNTLGIVSNTLTEEFSAKNVILMIGDGMGKNHIEVAKEYNQVEQLNMEKLSKYDGEITTHSKNSSVTDSAAAATAMSTGEKVNNGEVAMRGLKKLETMAEYAASLQKEVGIVATETLTGATPAAFSSHAINRDLFPTIIVEQTKSPVSLFLGEGKSRYNTYNPSITSRGFDHIKSFEDLPSYNHDKKIFGTFDRISPNPGQGDLSLSDLSLYAINYLEHRSAGKGFFLMIEGSYIDIRSHENNLFGMIDELNAFDQAVADVVNWATLDGNTQVMVVADHETGGLTYNGETKEEFSNEMFTSKDHTGTNVRYFLYGNLNNVIIPPYIIDNTDVSKIIRKTLNGNTLNNLKNYKQIA